MVCLYSSASKVGSEAVMFLRGLWTLRRRYCSGRLLLLGVAVCLFYQTLMVARSRFKGDPPAADERNKSTMTEALEVFDELLQDPARLISTLEALERDRYVSGLMIELHLSMVQFLSCTLGSLPALVRNLEYWRFKDKPCSIPQWERPFHHQHTWV